MFAEEHEVVDRAIKKDDYRRGLCVEQVVGREGEAGFCYAVSNY